MYPSITATANVYIKILAETKLTKILHKMPGPHFELIGSKIIKPFLVNLDEEDDGNYEFDLGALIVANSVGLA